MFLMCFSATIISTFELLLISITDGSKTYLNENVSQGNCLPLFELCED